MSTVRKGRGKAAASLAIIAKLQELAAVIAPCSVRAYCYQLFIAGYIDSMSKNNTNRVSPKFLDAPSKFVLTLQALGVRSGCRFLSTTGSAR